jgi:hypothetical protein
MVKGRFNRGTSSEWHPFQYSTRTPGRNWLSGTDQISERRIPRDVASEIYHELRDLTVFPLSITRNGYARAGPRAEGIVERGTDGFGRQTPSDVVGEQL